MSELEQPPGVRGDDTEVLATDGHHTASVLRCQVLGGVGEREEESMKRSMIG